MLDTVTLEQGFSPRSSPLPCQYHSTNSPFSSSSTCCSYQKDKWAKRGNLPQSSDLSAHWKFHETQVLACFGSRISGLRFSSFTPKKAGSASSWPCHSACQLARQAFTRLFCLTVCVPAFGRKLLAPAVTTLLTQTVRTAHCSGMCVSMLQP